MVTNERKGIYFYLVAITFLIIFIISVFQGDKIAVMYLIVSISLVKKGRQYRKKCGYLVLDEIKEPPTIFLRNFEEDEKSINTIDFSKIIFGFMDTDSLESYIISKIKFYSPFVAIGKPGEVIQSVGANRVYCNDSDWKKVAKNLILRAKIIIIFLKDTESIEWEVNEIIKTNKLNHALFIIRDYENNLNLLRKISIFSEDLIKIDTRTVCFHYDYELNINVSKKKPFGYYMEQS